MNEAQAIMAMPRTPHRIRLDLNAALAHRDAVREAIADLAGMSIGPIRWVEGEPLPSRDLNIPEDIQAYYSEAAHTVARLQAELANALRSHW